MAIASILNGKHPLSLSDIRLSAIVLFFHGEKWIHSCVRSLEGQTLPRNLYEIVLVNNGGSTPSVDSYKAKDNFRIIHLSQNYGFTGGNNRAFIQSRGEIVFLLNQDTIAHADCLKELLSVFDSHSEAGVVSANMKMISQEDSVDPNVPFDHATGAYKLSRLGYASYHVTKATQDVVPVDFVSGNGLGLRREILEDIGHYLFNENLGSYAEDLDLSLRLKKTKWKMVVCPRSIIYHYRSEAFAGKPLEMLDKFTHISTNRLIVHFWNLETTEFIKKLPALLLGIPLKITKPDGSWRLRPLMLIVSFLTLPIVILLFIIRLRKIAPERLKNVG